MAFFFFFSNFKTREEKQAHPSPDGEFKDEFLVYIPCYMVKVEPWFGTMASNSQFLVASLIQSGRQPSLGLLQRLGSDKAHLGMSGGFSGWVFKVGNVRSLPKTKSHSGTRDAGPEPFPPRKPQLHNSISNPPGISKFIPQQRPRPKAVPTSQPRPSGDKLTAPSSRWGFFCSLLSRHMTGGIKLGMRLRHTLPGFVVPAERGCPSARPRAPDGNERARSPRCIK